MKTLKEITYKAWLETLKKISKDRKYLQENKNLIFSIYPDGRILTTYLSREYSIETEVLGHFFIKYIKEHFTEKGTQIKSRKADSLSSSFDFTPEIPFNLKKTNMMNLKNTLAKIAETIKKETLEKILPDRKLMEDLKNDEMFTTKEDKNKILEQYIHYGWNLEDAIESRLMVKFYKEKKVELVKELFPDFEIKKEDDPEKCLSDM